MPGKIVLNLHLHFTIKDTSSPYQLFLVLRHNEKYNYNNIYINLYIQAVRDRTAPKKFRRDLLLATNEKGWLGTGMDDIYEHRIPLGDPQTLKAGNYTFTVEQIMREDPLGKCTECRVCGLKRNNNSFCIMP